VGRRHRNSPSVGYDSILDTVTNVVGVLILVGVVAQIGVSDAMSRVGPEATVSDADLESARAQRDSIRAVVEELRERLRGLDPDAEGRNEELEDLQARIRELEAEVQSPTDFRVRREGLDAEFRALTDELGITEDQITAAEAQREDLRTRLEDARNDVVEESARVTLPSPDATRADGREARSIVCKRGSTYRRRSRSLTDLEVEARSRALGGREPSSPSDLRACVEYFSQHDIGDETFRVRLYSEQSAQRVTFEGEHVLRDDAPGTTASDLSRSDSRYALELRKLDPTKDWLLFWVFDDSFEAYLEARRIAESRGFAVGWVAFGTDEKLRFSRFRREAGSTGRVALPD